MRLLTVRACIRTVAYLTCLCTRSDAVDYYALHIAEDDGEVDLDFPALDSREPIAKFDFARLALVERIIPRRHMSSIVVTMYALAAPAHPLAPITE